MTKEKKQENSKLKKGKSEKRLEVHIEKLEKEKKELNAELKKISEVAAHSQAQYVSLKQDFDAYQNRIENDRQESELKQFIDVVNLILPFVEELRKSSENLPDELKGNDWAKGVVLQYQKIVNKLKEKGVYEIKSIGEEPDHEYHEPIGMEASSKKMKGKIVKEYEKGFIYKNGEMQKLIKAAKVIVGN